MDAANCHACHAKVPQRHGAQARHQSQPSPISATPAPATWNEGRCRQVPRLPRKSAAAPRRPSAPPEPAQSHKCLACHVKRRWMSPGAKPASWNKGRCRQVPLLSRKSAAAPRHPSAPPDPAQSHKCYACHVKRRWMSPSATPASWNEGGCKVDVAKCCACHAKVPQRHGAQARHESQPSLISATPATRNEGRCRQVPCLPTWNEGTCRQVPRLPRETPGRCRQVPRRKRQVARLPRESCDKSCMWQSCVWQSYVWQSCVWQVVCDKVACDKLCVCVTKLHVTKLYVTKLCVCVTKLCVCDNLYVTKLYVTKLCVTKLCVTKLCVTKLYVTKLCVTSCVWQSCVWQVVCDKVVCDKVVCVCDKVVCDKVVCGRGGGTARGVQIQKQDPHTILWGKKHLKWYHLHLDACGIISYPLDSPFLSLCLHGTFPSLNRCLWSQAHDPNVLGHHQVTWENSSASMACYLNLSCSRL